MDNSNIYYVYRLEPHAKGHVEHVLVLKFALTNNHFEVLEDHVGMGLEKLNPAQAAHKIHRFTTSMYYDVVNLKDLLNGLHPEYLKDYDTKQAIDQDMESAVTRGASQPPSSDFEFDRIGGEGPRKLSVSDGQVFMDGHLLTQDEIDLVQGHIKGGKAFLRRKMAKAESIFNPGMDPKLLEEDHSIPGVGNLRAYNNFMNAPPPGLHMHVNLHDTKALNHTYGHDIGHRAIQATGKALHHVARTLIGKDARVFRLGGDKFAVHVPSTEGAALVARGLRQHLESIPPVNGTHALTVSVGVGPSKEHADWALHDANGEKNRRGYKPGQARTHVAMRIPGGLEGPLPVE